MPRSIKTAFACFVALLCISLTFLWVNPLRAEGTSGATHRTTSTASQSRPSVAKSSKPMNVQSNGPYRVVGNGIVGADGKRYLFHGIGRDSMEYSCWGDGHFNVQELSYLGWGTNTATVTYWGVNTVRLPLSEDIWLHGQSSESCSATQYRTLIKHTVDTLTTLKLNVILDLHWSDAGGKSFQGGGPWSMPDTDSILFWKQVASIYKSYSNVLFELYNEPHPPSWSCWEASCTITDNTYSNDCHCTKRLTFFSVGMQALVDAVRKTGATNLVVVAGMDWGFDLSQIARYSIKGANVVYDTHLYPYPNKQPNSWDVAFGSISKKYAVISAENGE